MSQTRHLILGALATAMLVALAALFSAWPRHRTLAEGFGVVKLSFSHGGDRSASCRPLSQDELAGLAPNMRRKEICARARPPVVVELEVDGEMLLRAVLPPSGIAGDGPSRIYKRFVLPAGEHDVAVRLRDTPRAEGFDYSAARRITLAPAQNLVIDFRPVAGGFVFN
ncbi:MAG: hypothetical protein ACOY99_04570 [Pseudomonadota bacterium]